jgi:class 3 adenylate cyclase
MPVEVPYLITSLCGAVILLVLNDWLRRRAVNDTSMIWLGISLLSWAAALAIELFARNFGMILPPDQVLYVFSPVSSILFTVTAFQLVQVREIFRAPEARVWPRIIISTVVFISTVACLLLLLKVTEIGKFLDAIASSLALITLGLGLAYSFHKYGHRFLVWLTGMTFLWGIARQFYVASFGSPGDYGLASLHLVNSTMMVMLFIAFAVAWGLSDTSRLRPVGISANVNVVVLCLDLRGSTQWASFVVDKDFHYVRTFIDELREWTWGHAAASPLGQPTFVKFMGDGFMFVWEVPDASVVESATNSARLGYFLYKHYQPWVKRKAKTFHWGVPVGIGVGIDTGPALRLTFENGSIDYLGAPVSYAAKMQDLARPDGGVVMQGKVWGLLNGLRGRFPRQGVLTIGDTEICVRATGCASTPSAH